MRTLTILTFLFLPLLLLAGTNLMPVFSGDSFSQNNLDLRAWHMTTLTWGNWATTDFNMANRTVFGFWQDRPMSIRTAAGEYLLENQWWGNTLIDYVPDANYEFVLQANHDNVTGMVTAHNFRYTYTYDEQHRLTDVLKEQYQPSTTIWMAYERFHVLYENGNLTETVGWQYNWGSPSYERYDYEYSNGKVSSQIRYASSDSTNWTTMAKSEYTYHTSDTSSAAGFVSYVSHFLPVLMPLDRDMSYGAYSQVVQSSWFAGAWTPVYISTYTYNTNNQLIECVNQVSYTPPINDQRLTYSYDTNGNRDTMIKYTWNGDWANQLKETYTWEYVVGNDDATVTPVSNLTMNVYPTPFTNHFNLNIASKERKEIRVGLYNIKGQCVLTEKITPNQLSSIDGTHLPNGIYFIKASQGSQTSVKKVIKFQ